MRDHENERRSQERAISRAEIIDNRHQSGARVPLEAQSRSGRVDPVERSDLGESENVCRARRLA